MKKPTIRNWIKYCAGTLAVSGMLVTTSCDSNNNQTAEYENEVEAVENEPTTLERENVNDEIAAVEEVETDADDRQTANETQPVAETNDNEFASNESQNQQASNRSSDMSAGTMPDMDSHIEEYKEPNRAISEELTDNNDMAGNQNMDRQNVSNTQTSDMNQESATDMNRQNTADMNQQDTSTDMDRENVTNTDTQESYQYGNEQQNTTQQTNTLDNQQNTTTSDVPQDSDMNLENNQQGTTNDLQQTEEINQDTRGTTQEMTGENETSDADVDEQAKKFPKSGEYRYSTGNQERLGTEEGSEDMNRQNTADMNQQDTSTDMDRENVTNTDSQESYQYGNDQQTNQQDNNTYDRQSNTDMNQEGDDLNIIIMERYSVDYADEMSEEERQRSEEIMSEYNTRRESMRGQMNEETGAYMSPEVEARPTAGSEQLLDQIQSNVNYPNDAQAAKMEGVIFVNFVVDEEGNVMNATAAEEIITPVETMEYTQPLNPTKFNEQEIEELKEEMRQEAIRAVQETSGQWQAGQQDGQAVKSEIQLPVRFNLEQPGADIENR
jgi:hypothetical protein